jgi:hypothetical protein
MTYSPDTDPQMGLAWRNPNWNTGRRLWLTPQVTSIKRALKHMARMPRGKLPQGADLLLGGGMREDEFSISSAFRSVFSHCMPSI